MKPVNKVPNFLKENDKVLVFDEVVNDIDFEKSGTKTEKHDSIEELKVTQEVEDGFEIIIEDSNKNRKILGYEQCLKESDIIRYRFSYSTKNITNYQNDLSELLVISKTSANQTISAKFKFSIASKHL